MRVIGIDPGYDRVGIAIVDKPSYGNVGDKKEILIYSECFTTSAKSDIYERLLWVGQRVRTIIAEYKPDVLAMETLFITKNQKTAMHVSEARGIIAYEAGSHGLPIFEFSPPQIKAAVTSDGRCDKRAIIKMIPLLIKMSNRKRHDDEYDAIAVALTCIASHSVTRQNTKNKSFPQL
jgi:crossover junction endodeoxyribonuclease RuvC